ncbi:MAG: hypothetical protein KAG97_11840, partial [Victivallales bacterium]|nr:hypothetical protein [Victivallales bacterium]
MKKRMISIILMLLSLFRSSALASDTYYDEDYIPSAPAAGITGSTAVHMSSNTIIVWANTYFDLQYGSDVAVEFQTPEKALGPAVGNSEDIVSLGRGGRITLNFPLGIADGPGTDFAVFENSFSDDFLELAYMEVSSDGTNFVRFPNYSFTPNSVPGFGTVDTRLIYGLAGKYRQGYGTPFDLNELRIAYNAQLAGNTDFSPAFAAALISNFPLLDLSRITHVRLVDVVGDGSALDAAGYVIYDPYP